jgi:LytR cell envelope-related transcriptional attenuator
LLEIVREIGGAAGFAAGVGLAVLSALYFSQARDIKRLRESIATQPVRRTSSPRRPQRSVTIPPRRSQPWYGRIGTRYVAVALVGLLVLGGAATQLTGGDDSSGNGLPVKSKRNGSAVKPGNVTVAVLNGTTVPGLAAALRDQIGSAGFKEGTINDFSDQQLAESVVQYAPGRQNEAKAVSRSIGIGQREPITSASRALAGDATVIVIAGADKAP